ncbi:alkylglycerol monooxygenase [Pungitius pungitius]|uniref:alkylglycerol monooxygenase n=1 Tax=Pungitius pungitius TaxID=134920 RepID=UPI002E131F14
MAQGDASAGFRSLFFMLSPNESSYQKLQDVPQYVQQATPFFVGLVVLEMVVGLLKTGSPVITVSDGLTSVSCGMISRIPLLFMRSCELTAYVFIWDRYHLMELPWDSAWTWWLTFLGVDFCYYWLHRLAHGTGTRHSREGGCIAMQCRWVESIFNVVYVIVLIQLIRDLGPLEWVFNTPKHHRVHHGRNEYCIDKNYGGILIIWDRLFGTFAEEADKVVFGLVFPINTFEILYVQLHYYLGLWRRCNTFETIGDKLSTFFKGPSWSPGKPRLGDHVDNPQVTGQEVPRDPSWPLPLQLYVVAHFLLALGTYHHLFENTTVLSQLTVLGMTCYVLLTLTSLGLIVDQRPTAAPVEMLRCVVTVTMQVYGHATPLPSSLAGPAEAFVSLSLLFWALQSSYLLLRIKKKAH